MRFFKIKNDVKTFPLEKIGLSGITLTISSVSGIGHFFVGLEKLFGKINAIY